MNVITKLLLGGILLISVTVANAQNVHGVLRVVKGDVQIKSAKSGQTVKARLGEQVFPKDVVITGKDARAKIVMVDNNEINISPDSQIEIQHYEFDPAQGKKDVLLNVIYGKVRSKVEQKYDGKTSKFQVKTPSAVAGVRGTDFLTSYNKTDNSSQVVTFRGAVEFGLPGTNGSIKNPVSVTPGKQASSVAGAPPAPPTNMPKEQLAKMDNDSKAETGGVGGKSDRAPSNDGKGEDKKDGDKKDGDKKSDNGKKPDSRAPASTAGPSTSTGGGSMIQPIDLPSSGGPTLPTMSGPTIPTIIPTTSTPTINVPPPCQTCSDLLQNSNTNLTVKVTH